MFVLGAAFGSFLCCQSRRLKYRETKKKKLPSRSICPKCKHQLNWYENIPLISWLIQGGKCRKCHAPIGWGEILSELGVALMFLGVASTVNIASAGVTEWCIFGTTIVFCISLAFLAIHDGLYGELPNIALYCSIILALAVFLAKNWGHFGWNSFTDALAAFAILGGLYLLLYLVSKGKWVGDGDWLIGAAIAIALGKPFLALVALFISNFTACFVMLPFVKGKKDKQIYFGPFLVIAYTIVVTFSLLIESMVI